MAGMVLGFAGKALGTAIGGPLGGAIGGFIGSALGGLVDGLLFPQKINQEGPRLTDLRIQASTYGNAIPLMFGPNNRTAGNLIWSSGLIETVKKTKQGGKGGPTVTTTEYSYRAHIAVALCEPYVTRIKKVWANGKLIFDDTIGLVENTGLASALRIYPGDFLQMPDPLIESFKGVGNAPAYRGTAYVLIADLQLADYGNRLPNLEFLVCLDPAQTVTDAVETILIRSGVDPRYYCSTYQAMSDLLDGYMIGQPTTAAAALQPLALAYDFDMTDQAGDLRLVKRGSAPLGIIKVADLDGRGPDDAGGDPIKWSRRDEKLLPRESSVTFADSARDFQPNSVSSVRNTGSSDSNLGVQLAMSITPDHGKRIADRLLWEAINARQMGDGSVTDRWINLKAGHVYLFETPAGLEPLRITRRTRGANGVIEFSASRDSLEVYGANNMAAAGAPAAIPEKVLHRVGETTLLLIDGPLLADADDSAGFYMAAAGQLDGWRGADIKRSTDAGVTYSTVAQATPAQAAILGQVQGVLDDGPTAFWDMANTLTILLDNDSDALESLTEAEVLAGGNACWIGRDSGADGEVLQFQTATELNPGLWQLSKLLRGRLGTEAAVPMHGGLSTDERFVLLEAGALQRIDFGTGDWNLEREFRPVTVLMADVDAPHQPFTNTGAGRRPLSPVHPAGARDSSDNLTLTWIRRSRYRQLGLGSGETPLGETSESYEVDFLDGVIVVRTVAAATPTAAYSAADQTADGLTPGNPISGLIYQLSDTYGRGEARAFTV